MSSTQDPDFDYCPFCGMHLPVGGFDAHLEQYDDCADRFAARRETGGESVLDDADEYRQEPSAVRTGVMVLIVVVILAYSLLIAGQLLLGVLASGVVVAAFMLATRL